MQASTPCISVADSAVLGDVQKLLESGITCIVHVVDGAPSDCKLPCASISLSRPLRAHDLADGAATLRGALSGECPPLKFQHDLEPAESSEEEGGSIEGVRLRVRVSRSVNEKWGVKWHKDMFKKWHRFVVDDIAEDGIIARWNELQPPSKQVRYGDRLLRINGVQMSTMPAEQLAAKMRAELQHETMRALFWRPGADEGAPRSRPKAAAPEAVLVCASGRVAGACAVVAAHMLFERPATGLDGVLLLLGEAAARALREPDAVDLLAGLEALAADANLAASTCSAAVAEASCRSSLEPVADLAAAATAVAETGPDVALPRPARVAGPDLLSADGVEALATDGITSADEGGEHDATPLWTYSCRKCGAALFHDLSVQPHSTGGIDKRLPLWQQEQEALAKAQAIQAGVVPEPEEVPEAACTCVFVEPMEWMGSLEGSTGKLVCGNPRCRQKLGRFCWHGLSCSCGQWQSPAFQIHSASIDCMPATRRVRGPLPKACF